MADGKLTIRPYDESDEDGVACLWREVFPNNPPWNEPKADIARKLGCQRELFLVGVSDGRIVATVMAGFDGHRGWVHLVAVSLDWRGQAFGRTMMIEAVNKLRQIGCTKFNLQVRETGTVVFIFGQTSTGT